MLEELDEDYSRNINHRIPAKLLSRLVKFGKEHKYKTRVDVINDLLELGLIVHEHKPQIKDEHLKQEIMTQLREGSLVDYYEKLPQSDLTMIQKLAFDEINARKAKRKTPK